MDVLNPKLIWVEGRCYRVQDCACNDNITPYIEDDCQMDYEEEEEFDDNEIKLVPYGANKFKHTFHVAKSFFSHIVGAKNATRAKIEAETKTNILVPKVNQDGDIEITGSHRKGIILARHRIDLLIESVRRKLRPTHFLSIPLNDGHIIMNFNTFKHDVLNNHAGVSPIDETIFQIPSKLHLTIGMLILYDDVERRKAAEALNYCKEHILKPIIEKYEQITIHLQGTDIMNDDPGSTKILYAKVANGNDGLQELANKIADYYSQIGLITRQRGRVKLHVTLMNTRFQSDDEEMPNKAFNTFDATTILKAHENTLFGETVAKQIHISQLHTISDDGYYQATAKINLLDKK